MMGKSLNYAYPTTYAEGGPVNIRPPTGGMTFTAEQQQQMDEANARRIAAEASTAESNERLAAIHAANPNIDFSDAGRAAIIADAQSFLASPEAQSAAAFTATPTPDPIVAPTLDPMVMDIPDADRMDMPTEVPEETYTPQTPYETQYQPMPEASLQDVLGNNAGQDAYQAHVQQTQMQPQVMPVAPQSFYTPPSQLGIGSFTPEILAQQQQAGYLMSSTPSVFTRPYVTNYGDS